MSNAKTGIWSAFGALLGGALGATAGHYAARARPRFAGKRVDGDAVEDAMVVGGASGAVVGAFIAGSMASEDEAPKQLP